MDDHQKLTDIIDACKRGEQQAYASLVDLFANRLYGYFYRLTGNAQDSNDLLSELFLRLVTKIGYYDSGSFDTWLFKIASNLFYDHLRARKREKHMLDSRKQQLIRSDMENGDSITDLPGADHIQDYLNELDIATREMIMLRFYSELSFKEIAKIRKEPIGTVLSKVHRGLARLRQLMEKHNEPTA